MIRQATEEDFEWIYKLYEKNKFSLGPCYTASIRKSLSTNQMIVDTEGRGFCEYHLPVRTKHIAVYNICVDTSYRRCGLASDMIEYLKNNYSYPIRAVCIPETDAEYFWKAVSTKIGEKKTRKGNTLHIYNIDNQNKMEKEILF